VRHREEGLGQRRGRVTIAPDHGVEYPSREGEREGRYQGQPAQASKSRGRHVSSPLSVGGFALHLDYGSREEARHRAKGSISCG
jgi:hypothetical protein